MDGERKKKLLRRVEKLLRQSEGTTFAGEAETALLMAQRILLENGMTMAEVDALSKEEQKNLVDNQELVSMGRTHSEWLLSLARVIIKNFRCKYWIHHQWGRGSTPTTHQIRIIGLAEDVAIARDVYSYARSEAERLAKAYASDPHVIEHHLYQKDSWKWMSEWTPAQKAAANREVQRIWREGFVEGLAAKFKEQVRLSESMALMLVIHPVVKDAYDNLGLGTSRFRSQQRQVSNDAAHRAGFQAGRAFEPRRPERIGPHSLRIGSGS